MLIAAFRMSHGMAGKSSRCLWFGFSIASLVALPAGGQALPSGDAGAAEQVRFYHADALGSVRAVTDLNGQIVSRSDYLPYGEELATSLGGRDQIAGYGEDAGNKQKFTGKERDLENGLDYFGARYFSGAQARFTTVDPSRESADLENPQSWNRYTYALNNPLRYKDPDGKSPTVVTGAIGAGIGFIFGYAGSVVSQAYQRGTFEGVDYDKAAIAGVGSGVSAGLAGLTLGLSVVAEAGAVGVIAVAAGTNVIGAAVSREVDADPSTRAGDVKEIAFDAASGAAGGVIGVKVQQAVSAPIRQLNAVAEGMKPAARAGDFGAARGMRGIRARADRIRADAEIIATVAGSKTTDFAAPVARTVVEKKVKDEQEDRER